MAHKTRTMASRRQNGHEKDRLNDDADGIEKLRSAEVNLRIKKCLVAAQRNERLGLERRHEPEQTQTDEIDRRGNAARAGAAPVPVKTSCVFKHTLDR